MAIQASCVIACRRDPYRHHMVLSPLYLACCQETSEWGDLLSQQIAKPNLICAFKFDWLPFFCIVHMTLSPYLIPMAIKQFKTSLLVHDRLPFEEYPGEYRTVRHTICWLCILSELRFGNPNGSQVFVLWRDLPSAPVEGHGSLVVSWVGYVWGGVGWMTLPLDETLVYPSMRQC